MKVKRFKEKAKEIMDEHGALHIEDVEQLLKLQLQLQTRI